MKTFWITLSIIIVVVIIAIIWYSGQKKEIISYSIDDPNAPRLEMQEKKFDFGIISLSDDVKHEFKIKNMGKNPLVISNLMTSCHCTKVVLKVSEKEDPPEFGMHVDNSWQEEIPVETEAIIEVIYKPALMPVNGQVSRVISFSTNDPVNKAVQLEVSANVQ